MLQLNCPKDFFLWPSPPSGVGPPSRVPETTASRLLMSGHIGYQQPPATSPAHHCWSPGPGFLPSNHSLPLSPFTSTSPQMPRIISHCHPSTAPSALPPTSSPPAP